MYHIIYSNPEAWRISERTGVYGNVESGNERANTFWGKTVDLLALIPGDEIFFYVKEDQALRGLYEVSSDLFFVKMIYLEIEMKHTRSDLILMRRFTLKIQFR